MLGTYLQRDPNLNNYLYDDWLAKMRAASSSNVNLKPDGPSFLRRVYNRGPHGKDLKKKNDFS